MAGAESTIEKILTEADALLRRRLEQAGIAIPHVVVAVTPDNKVLLRSNVGPDILRAFSDDLRNVADDLERTLGTSSCVKN